METPQPTEIFWFHRVEGMDVSYAHMDSPVSGVIFNASQSLPIFSWLANDGVVIRFFIRILVV